MSGVECSSVIPVWCTSCSMNSRRITPWTTPPAASAASATDPINPVRPPP
jgi:hypothetical protein